MIKFLPEETLLGTHVEGETFTYVVTAEDEQDDGMGGTTSSPVDVNYIKAEPTYEMTLEVVNGEGHITGPAYYVFTPQELKYMPLDSTEVVDAGNWQNLPDQVEHMISFKPSTGGTVSVFVDVYVLEHDNLPPDDPSNAGSPNQRYEIQFKNDWTAGRNNLVDAVNNREKKYGGEI